MDYLKKVKDILYKDVSAENELKELAVLLRILCILNAFFHLSFFIYSFSSIAVFPGAISLISAFCMLIVLYITYRDKTKLSLILYTIVLGFSSVFYCVFFGTAIGFQTALFSAILLFYYKTDEKPSLKVICSILCGLTVIIASFYTVSRGAIYIPSDKQSLILYTGNTVIMMITIMIISHFYCLKFLSSEEKILLYAKKLEHLATIDTLTKLQNRRGMMRHIEKLANGYTSTNVPFSLVLSDIDFFKKVNDTYGHDAGDYVLSTLAAILEEFMRGKGRVARWGGEEFLFVFEGNNGDIVFEELNKLKFLIEKSIFTYKDYIFSVTMTFGLEEFDYNLGIDKTIEKADAKLYQGKERGRNCVIY